MKVGGTWRNQASQFAARGRGALGKAYRSLRPSTGRTVKAATATLGEAYSAALDWKDNAELSRWLTQHFSHQAATTGSKAMDAEYFRSPHIGGGWHRLYDGGHTLAGSWHAVSNVFPDLSALDKIGVWANEYWKDFITTRGMPIVLLDHADKLSDYFKHLDCVNLAQTIGGELVGVSIYCNWDNPAKLVASATASDCSSLAYANVVAPLVNLIGLGRAYYLLKRSDQDDLRALVEPALRGLTRSGASIALISVVPGGFLLHLSSGVVIGLAHGYVWDTAKENKDTVLRILKDCLHTVSGQNLHRPLDSAIPSLGA